jgi:capsular polysaccharide biosynthesis protein
MDTPRHEFDSTNVFFFFIRWWKHLAIICFLAALAGAIFSGPRFIKPKFEATTTMFPNTAASLSRSVILAWKDFNEFGELEEAERLLQVLESAAIRDRVVERFDLATHYEIEPDAKYRLTQLRELYKNNFNFRRTRYGAVEIRVRDKDPQMAADMANYVNALVDTVMNEIRRDHHKLAYDVAQKEYYGMLAHAKVYQDTLDLIMQMGVINVESQVMMIMRQMAMDISENNVMGAGMLEDQLKNIGDYGSSHIFQSSYLRLIANDMMVLQRRYMEAKADFENFIPFKFNIDQAYVPEKKVFPVRWLIVFLSAFGAGFMGVMVMMVYESLLAKGIVTEKGRPART